MRNPATLSAVRTVQGHPDITAAHVFYPGNDGIERSTSETDIVGLSQGDGNVAVGLDMQGTLGTALSANDGWLTLTGASSHCYAATVAANPTLADLYNAGGSLLMFAQVNASFSTNSNSSPAAISLGSSRATGDVAARLSLNVDRPNNRSRVQVFLPGGAVQTFNGANNDVPDDTTKSLTVYLDFSTGQFVLYVDGVEADVDTPTGDVAGYAKLVDPTYAQLVVGGADSGSGFASATLWEDMVRRAGVIGFSAPLASPDALALKLHQQGGIPAGLFRGLT